jgi:hypothetical protein
VPALVNPVTEQVGHSFQSVFRIVRPFLPTHRFPLTIRPHSPLMRVALCEGVPQFVHRATGFGLGFTFGIVHFPDASLCPGQRSAIGGEQSNLTKSLSAHIAKLRELAASAKEYGKVSMALRTKWDYYREPTLYVLITLAAIQRDNPDLDLEFWKTFLS